MEEADFKVHSRIRNVKIKSFRIAKPNDDQDQVDAANDLLEKMKIDGPTATGDPPYTSRSY